jgi:uncharacterized protein YdeI (YjbR/CyaY-like superfamily)
MIVPDGLPVLGFATRADWERWLDANHATSPGLWMKLAKKGVDSPSIGRPDALEVALCYGWIDSQARSIDERFWLQRFTPRRARSKWSQVNREAVQALIERGLMKPAGLAEVEAAKKDGRWDQAYASPRNMTAPDDWLAALAANPTALRRFEEIDAQSRFAILYRIHDAKRADTRARRIEKYVAMLAAGEPIR